eukprot:Sdes_comp16317_c0_seq1m5675
MDLFPIDETSILEENQRKRSYRRYLEEKYDAWKEIIVTIDYLLFHRSSLHFLCILCSFHLLLLFLLYTAIPLLTLLSTVAFVFFLSQYIALLCQRHFFRTRVLNSE